MLHQPDNVNAYGRLTCHSSIGGLAAHRKWPVLCGAAPEAHHHHQDMEDVERVRDAAAAEPPRSRDSAPTSATQCGSCRPADHEIIKELPVIRNELAATEAELQRLAPAATEARRALTEVMDVRDEVTFEPAAQTPCQAKPHGEPT
jgi:hypothetical protein